MLTYVNVSLIWLHILFFVCDRLSHIVLVTCVSCNRVRIHFYLTTPQPRVNTKPQPCVIYCWTTTTQ